MGTEAGEADASGNVGNVGTGNSKSSSSSGAPRQRKLAASPADIMAWALAAATRTGTAKASGGAASSPAAGSPPPGTAKAQAPAGLDGTGPASAMAPPPPPAAGGTSSLVRGLSPVAMALLGEASEVPVPADDDGLEGAHSDGMAGRMEGNGMEKAGDGVEAIQALLSKLGLMQYFDKFVENGFDTMAALELMNEADMLEECGMSPEHAKALQRFLAGEVAQPPSKAPPLTLPPAVQPPSTAASTVPPPRPPPRPPPPVQVRPPAPPPSVPLPDVALAGGPQPPGPLPAGMISPKSASVQAASSKASGQAPPPANEFIKAHVAKVASTVLGHSGLEADGDAVMASSGPAADSPLSNPMVAGTAPLGPNAGCSELALVPVPAMPLELPCPAGNFPGASNLPACLRAGADALQSKLAALPAPEKLSGAGQPGGLGSGGQSVSSATQVPPGVRAMLKNQPQQQQQQQPQQPQQQPQQPQACQANLTNAIEELGDPVAVAMAAAQQPGGAANTLYTLAQMAQESAQYAQQAAALTSNPSDAAQAMQMADAAEQAAQRAAWATTAVAAYEPPEGSKEQGDSYIISIKQICQQASETAEQAAATCRTNANNAKAVEEMLPAGPRGEKRSRVPCGKFFETGICQKGSDCPLSHNPSDKKPLPLWQKRQYMCTFFEEDKCIRGASCAFAHGAEELDMIKKFKAALKEQRAVPAKRPGDWDCPGCGDRQFARNGSCRKCGEPRPLGAQPLGSRV